MKSVPHDPADVAGLRETCSPGSGRPRGRNESQRSSRHPGPGVGQSYRTAGDPLHPRNGCNKAVGQPEFLDPAARHLPVPVPIGFLLEEDPIREPLWGK